MTIPTVLHRFRRLRPVPNHTERWTAACNVHKGGQERRPSLYLWINRRNGHLMGRCFACGARLPAQLQEIGVSMNELSENHFDDERARTSAPPMDKRKIAHEFIYEDEERRPLFKVCRWEPKAFHQERCTGVNNLGKYEWAPGLADCVRVPYRLPDWHADSLDVPLVIVEGEKDVDRLWTLGLHATTNVGGTGMGWQDSYSQLMRGRRVVVVPDNDATGWRHAYTVAGSLLYWGAASVRVVGLGHGAKDASEYLDQKGNTKQTLCELIRAELEWRPVAAVAKAA